MFVKLPNSVNETLRTGHNRTKEVSETLGFVQKLNSTRPRSPKRPWCKILSLLTYLKHPDAVGELIDLGAIPSFGISGLYRSGRSSLPGR